MCCGKMVLKCKPYILYYVSKSPPLCVKSHEFKAPPFSAILALGGERGR